MVIYGDCNETHGQQNIMFICPSYSRPWRATRVSKGLFKRKGYFVKALILIFKLSTKLKCGIPFLQCSFVDTKKCEKKEFSLVMYVINLWRWYQLCFAFGLCCHNWKIAYRFSDTFCIPLLPLIWTYLHFHKLQYFNSCKT